MLYVSEQDRGCFALYDAVPMLVDVRSEYRVTPDGDAPGGCRFEEVPVEPYTKDLGAFERASDYEKQFDITNWRFYMAFDGDRPVGAATVAGTTPGLQLLEGTDDACVLWDIRVADGYKRCGIGQRLFDLAAAGARADGYKQMVIESQNNNVPACRFYRRQGAQLAKLDPDAYRDVPGCENEVQLLWRLAL